MFLGYFCSSERSRKQAGHNSHCAIHTYDMVAVTSNIDSSLLSNDVIVTLSTVILCFYSKDKIFQKIINNITFTSEIYTSPRTLSKFV